MSGCFFNISYDSFAVDFVGSAVSQTSVSLSTWFVCGWTRCVVMLVLVWRKSIHFWRRLEAHKKRFLHFLCQWPWPLTFRPQICSLGFSCPALCFHFIRSFYDISISRKSEGQTDGRTGGNTCGALQRHIIRYIPLSNKFTTNCCLI